jgi:cytidylate kinase
MAVLAIGRQHSSLGHAIGRTVAERLSSRLVDTTTITADAARYGAHLPARGPDLEEHQPSLLERLRQERSRYRTMLRCAVTNVAQEGNVVIIGLASPTILRDVRHVVKVAVVAQEATRINRLVHRASDDGVPALTPEEARRILRQSDRQRAGYLRYLFDVDWLDPQTYDVMINTDQLSAEVAVSHILDVVRCPELHPTPESLERLADLARCSRIEATLMDHPDVWVNRPQAVMHEDDILLTGQVGTPEDAARAVAIASELAGGRRVVNQLRTLPILDTV